jgi:hypothetical protein
MNSTIRSFRFIIPTLALFGALALIAGCGGGNGAPSPEGGADDEAAPQTNPGTADAGGVSDDLFLAVAPDDVRPLFDVKSDAAVGDEVVFEGRIGGRVEPFTASVATFLVADPSIMTCTERHGDGCPTPWDYCCEPKDNLMKNLATVQIVDADGRPLRQSVKGMHGLEPEARIVVVGTVSQSDGPTFVVDAKSIYVDRS